MERLKEVRVNSGATQQEIARALKIDRTTYNKYENGASNPTPETLSRIADYFHVSVDYLLGRSDGRTIQSRKTRSPRTPRSWPP